MATADTTAHATLPGSREHSMHERSRAIERARRGDRLAIAGRMVGVALLAATAGYVGGRIHGAVLMSAVESRAEQADAQRVAALDEGERRVDEVESRVAALSDRVQLLESARHLALARLALDAQNFGIAGNHLRQAEDALSPIDAPDAVTLRADIAGTRLVASADLDPSRAHLASLADRADALLAPSNTLEVSR